MCPLGVLSWKLFGTMSLMESRCGYSCLQNGKEWVVLCGRVVNKSCYYYIGGDNLKGNTRQNKICTCTLSPSLNSAY